MTTPRNPVPTTIFGAKLGPRRNPSAIPDERHHFHTLIVGAGFSGLGMAIRLKRDGIHDFAVLERATDVGGTWFANTYPGCRCDTPSRLYSFAFAPNPDWTETYARQPEIHAYLRRLAEREHLLGHLRFGTDVTGARWDDTEQRWRIATSSGEYTATCLIGAMGPLSAPKIPDFPGKDTFAGPAFHSARWDHDVDLTGKRVAVIGTGATAVQIVPEAAKIAGRLDVYQRSAAWVPPHTGRRTSRLERALYRMAPFAQRLPRAGVYYQRELYVRAWTRSRRQARAMEAVVGAHLRRQIRDPELRRKLTPDYRLGCKRPTPSNDYYPAFTCSTVDLITDGIAEIRPHSIVAADGTERDVDVIVYATGFHVTDAPHQHFIRGRDGRTLDEAWNGSPNAYLGTTVSGFPNLFLLLGPNTGNLTTSVVLMAESQIDYVLASLRALRSAATIEPRPEAQAAYTADIQTRSAGSVWLQGGCESWYLDRTGRNSTLWPDFSWRFDARTRHFRPEHHILTPKAGTTIAERTVTVAGTRTRLLELAGTGPTLLFVHGVTDCADFWRPVFAHLAAAGRRAIAVDLPGFGHADPLRPGPVLPQLDKFLDELLAETGAAVVVGHSTGGTLALRLAERAPEELLGVVAAPPAGLAATALHALGARLPRWPLAPIRLLPDRVRRKLIAAFWTSIAVADRGAVTPEFLNAYTGFFSTNFARYLGTAQLVLRELRDACHLDRVRHPLLLIWGTRDRLSAPQSAQQILDAVPGSRLVTVEGAGHCPAVESPARFAAATLAFANSLTRTRPT
ncbi:alpha/beta fold hydrolase [Amycolatopsis sp. VS8301801F10]|uniref:alpha/beta fold hydrolase n=1 Tax=Amycolatopsis sp. VS8301801F10 TaxID=2652442 RepID=UPI0038FC589C